MAEKPPLENSTSVFAQIRQGSFLILTCFFFAHATFHFMTQSFSVMLPAVKSTFGINPIQIGALITAKELAAGLAALPGGMLSDYLSHQRALIMTTCMILFGIGWLLIGLSPFYGLLLVGMVIIAVASAVWHLPSLAELGKQFSRSRGAVFALHGAGGSLGDIFGPVITGLLLSVVSWRSIISIYSLVPLIMSAWIFWAFSRSDRPQKALRKQPAAEARNFKEQLDVTRDILRRTHIWRVNLVAGFRGMCFTVIVTFMPLFMKEQLGFNSAAIGFHIGLLWSIGIVASPLMGHLSDRWGRKRVLVPALFYSSLLIFLLSFCEKGMIFTLLIALLGISIRSDYSLIYATILDITGNRMVTTMLGVLSLTRFMIGAVSPLIAGALYQYIGMQATLIFVAVLFGTAAVIFSTVDVHKKA